MNPYKGADFFSFFQVLITRLFSFEGGLYSDEKQLLVMMGVAFSSALVGGLLLLRRMTMMANALSHTVLLGVVVAFLLLGADSLTDDFSIAAFLLGALLSAVFSVILIALFKTVFRLQEDASIGLVFAALFAFAILLVTVLTKSAHIGTEVVMGSGDLVLSSDIAIVWIAALFNALLIGLFFKEFRLSSFDPLFAKTVGFCPQLFFWLLMLLSALVIVSAMRAVGVVIVLSFLVTPPLIAKLYAKTFRQFVLLSSFVGLGGAFMTVALSRHLLSVYSVAVSTSGLTATLFALVFLILVFFRKKSFRIVHG